MKLLIVTQSADVIGGANRSLLDVIDGLINIYHHECVVLAPGRGSFTETLEKKSVQCVIAPYRQTSFVTRNDIYDFYRHLRAVQSDFINIRLIQRIYHLFERKMIDCVYINDTTNTFGYRLAQKLKVPYVWHFRGYNKTIKKYMYSENRFIHDNNGTCIMISKAMYDYMKNYRHMKEENMTVVYNGVINNAEIIPQPWHTSITNGFHCVHCGHISEAKGQEDSVRAVAKLIKNGYKDIYLHLAGSPFVSHGNSYGDYINQLAEKEGISEHVIFEGEVKNMNLLRQKMQVELMCSVAEPFGRVTVEGMQSGLVVIGADSGATPEIIADGENGLLYRQGDFSDLAEKIQMVYDDYSLGDTLSSNALEFVKHNFTMDENIRQIERIIYNRSQLGWQNQ